MDLIEGWSGMNHFLLIGVLLFIAQMAKVKIPFFERVIIPTSLLAGFLGLLFSDGFLGLYTLDREGIITGIVYHGLSIAFIAVTLKKAEDFEAKRYWTTGSIIVLGYLLQAFIGIVILWIFFKDVFLGGGILLALGFGQGPGLASSIGGGFERSGQMAHGLAFGASLATLGFFWGGVVGVWYLNQHLRRHHLQKFRETKPKTTHHDIMIETIDEITIFDSLTMHLVVISIIYTAAYFFLAFVENHVFTRLGGLGKTLGDVFHGFNFLIAMFFAVLAKKFISWQNRRGKNINFITNTYILGNITSIAFNFLITASVMSITIEAVKMYYLPLLVISTVGGVSTLIFVRWICHKVHDTFVFERILAIFGNLTGTVATGISLLTGVDHDLETPIADEIVVSSGNAIMLALPLLVVIGFPIKAAEDNNPFWNYLTLGIVTVYFILLLTVLLLKTRGRRKK